MRLQNLFSCLSRYSHFRFCAPLSQFYVAVFVTALADVPYSSQQSAPTYQWTDAQTGEAVTCEMCPPGTYVGSHCSKKSRTQCLPCAESQYTEVWNYIDECLMCDYPCSEVQEEVRGCKATHNRLCRCKQGYYSSYGYCLRHTVCPPGEGVRVNGKTHTLTHTYTSQAHHCSLVLAHLNAVCQVLVVKFYQHTHMLF